MSNEAIPGAVPAETTPAAVTPNEPSPVNLADDALLEFNVGGEPVRKSWAEIRQTQGMLPADYTRKTMALAEERKRFADEQASFQSQREQVEQARAQLASIVQDPNKLASLYLATVASKQSQNQGQNQAPAPDYNQLREQFKQEWKQEFQQFQTAQVAQKIEADMGAYATGLLKSHPTLAVIDGIEEAIFSKVTRMNPSSVDEAKDFAKLIVDQMAEKQNTVLAEREKEKAVSRSKLQGIEPKGGHVVTAKKRQYGDIDDPKRMEDMVAFMQQMLSQDE